jgi:hypothetical protein
MGFSQSGAGSSGNPPTGVILVGVVIFALILAFAAKNSREIPADNGPQPIPSVTATK